MGEHSSTMSTNIRVGEGMCVSSAQHDLDCSPHDGMRESARAEAELGLRVPQATSGDRKWDMVPDGWRCHHPRPVGPATRTALSSYPGLSFEDACVAVQARRPDM